MDANIALGLRGSVVIRWIDDSEMTRQKGRRVGEAIQRRPAIYLLMSTAPSPWPSYILAGSGCCGGLSTRCETTQHSCLRVVTARKPPSTAVALSYDPLLRCV